MKKESNDNLLASYYLSYLREEDVLEKFKTGFTEISFGTGRWLDCDQRLIAVAIFHHFDGGIVTIESWKERRNFGNSRPIPTFENKDRKEEDFKNLKVSFIFKKRKLLHILELYQKKEQKEKIDKVSQLMEELLKSLQNKQKVLEKKRDEENLSSKDQRPHPDSLHFVTSCAINNNSALLINTISKIKEMRKKWKSITLNLKNSIEL